MQMDTVLNVVLLNNEISKHTHKDSMNYILILCLLCLHVHCK